MSPPREGTSGPPSAGRFRPPPDRDGRAAGDEAGFLGLPARASKPRPVGLTHVLDRGVPLANFEPLVASIARFTDIWKFGWGTSYLDRDLGDKLAILARHQVLACPGGTLAEIAWLRGRIGDFLAWAEAVGFPAVEISNGATAMTATEKRRLIALAADRFVVLSEVGSKDPRITCSPADLARQAQADLEAGARWIVLEGREHGNVGLYREDGSVREEVVEAMVSAPGPGPVVFEAPRKEQQAWLIRRLGRDVNLGNVAPAEVLGLETLRLGLRADTLFLLSADPERPADA